ncbi:phosphatidylethanolamine-binding protein [Lineolata rhizophorae]|uniref:Phosphatidylethanolamine-binding protein n=1 Tax=Lineolata rhizophorae TaxID=578093 RepID=A0A6A6NYT9_9PEZI|nr:phosphatidylethanolamine-binding protein [Lineolata rhizophorae]
MRSATALSAILLAAFAQAQTPEGFTPEVEDRLEVIVGDTYVSPAGLELTEAETQPKPQIGTNDTVLEGTYVYMVIDPDAPIFNPDGSRSTVCHAVLSDYTSSGMTNDAGTNLLTTTSTSPLEYMGPAPPAEDPPFAHRYIHMLFEQPDDFEVPPEMQASLQQRINFDFDGFREATGLGDPIRANFWRVTGQGEPFGGPMVMAENGTNSSTASMTMTTTSTMTMSTTVDAAAATSTSEDAALPTMIPKGLAAVVGGLAPLLLL